MKTVILGAGASGLGVALGLVEKGVKDVVVIEKEAVVGGLSGSVKIGENTVDFGPHRFSPEYPDLADKMKSFLGEDWLEVSNDHAVVFKGRVYRYPPVIADFLNVSTMLICVRTLASFFWCRLASLFGKKNQDETFESIIVSRFGRVLYDEVVKPMSWKVWGDPKTLDPQFAKLRFSVPTIVQWWRKLVGTTKEFNDKVFYYPRRGFQQLWDRLADHLKEKGVEIWCGAQVKTIETEKGRVVGLTVLKDGKEVQVPIKNLVSTIPTQAFTRLLKPSPLSASEMMGAKFQNRGMLLVYYLLKKEKTLPARVVIFPETNYLFNRLSEQNQFSRDTVAAGHSVILADVLADVGTETWNIKDGDLIRQCTEQLLRLGFVSAADIVETKVLRFPIAYPLPTRAREEDQRKFNRILGNFENLICTGRFASSDYNNSHTALRKGLMAAEAIASDQQPSEWYETAEKIRQTAIRD